MRLVDDARADVADVHVDAVAEDQDLDQRDADDHAAGQPISPELQELLEGDGLDAREGGEERVHAEAPPSGGVPGCGLVGVVARLSASGAALSRPATEG